MWRKAAPFLAAIVPAIALILLCSGQAQAQRGGYYRGGGYGYYRGGYGFYRPYGYGWYGGYPFFGIGIGLYAPYYGSYAYPLPPGVVYAPPVVAGSAPVGPAPNGDPNAPPPATAERPPPDNAGHLQLIVPANAEVFVDGQKIAQSGTTREIVSPPVKAGTRYTYKISVRYTDPQGKPMNDTRDITFQANDWFSIDFTRPAPPMAPPPQPVQPQPPMPLPNPLR